MQYVIYVLMVAVIFGLIALTDFLLKKLFPKNGTYRHGKAVRMPRYSVILGILLTILGLLGLLYIPPAQETLLWCGCLLVILIGAYLLINYHRFGIFYDDEQFICRTLTGRAKTYRYGDIRFQQSFLARSGINILLHTADDEIQLYSAMQGLDDFLHKAFYRWCAEKGLDPETVPHDPAVLSYFPTRDELQP